ncbi:LamB/YcsF family protein [Marinomonas transparens]|uniref:5-oxoprolinase subunit PxpA n=1 Tax=Marinomonas transparens TaxID=2795388 RepID=A0A934N2C4_9GAMM|nr:5-oxoprolinase subunit PxpA [Marinomonas transparens]MBJ7538612.1 5-oxoprolinase subunit PxpA [Marinomonas transparens]
MKIDLNADLGEGFGPYQMGDDDALIPILSSANVACGFHAGDPLIMRNTVRSTKFSGVDLGAHVGFADVQGFGRNKMELPLAELESLVTYQLGALAGFARSEGHTLTHMSFHGALGNKVAADNELAEALINTVAKFDSDLIISSSSSVAIESAAQRHGLRVETTFLADRAYDASGLLVPRAKANSVIKDEKQVLQRIEQLLNDGTVTCYDGERIAMPARSILVHGDTDGAVNLAAKIRRYIEDNGGVITPLSLLVN